MEHLALYMHVSAAAADGILYKFHSALYEIDANMYLGIWLYIAGKLREKSRPQGSHRGLALPSQL
jgi:hypothetical protein